MNEQLTETQEVVRERVQVVVHRFHWCTAVLRNWIMAQAQASDVLIVVIGATQSSPSGREPLPLALRQSLREQCLQGVPGRVLLLEVPDLLYQPQAWGALLQRQCDAALGNVPRAEKWLACSATVERNWQFWFHHPDPALADSLRGPLLPLPAEMLEAERQMRQQFFATAPSSAQAPLPPPFEQLCAAGTASHYAAFKTEAASRPLWQRCQRDFQAVQAFVAAWDTAPYPPIFHTVDALVKCRLVQPGAESEPPARAEASATDYVLLIQRGQAPGEGLWAIPGGFLEVNETREVGALRELAEETGLRLAVRGMRETPSVAAAAAELLPAKCLGHWVVDAPRRSARGRIITTVYVFDLGELTALPPVAGADDAAHAEWVTLSHIRAEACFEDHCFLLSQASLRFGWSASK